MNSLLKRTKKTVKTIRDNKKIFKMDFLLSHPMIKTSFFRNIRIIFFFNVISYVLIALSNLLVIRIWGPAEYGRIALIQNLQSFLFIPVLMGNNNAMYKFLPKSSKDDAKKTMGSGFYGTLAGIIFFTTLYFIVFPVAGRLLKVPFNIWRYAVIFSVINSLFIFSESCLRGSKRFSLIGRFRLIGASIFFVLIFLILFFYKPSCNFRYFFISFFIYQGFFIFLAFYSLKMPILHFDFSRLSRNFRYGGFMMLNLLLTTLLFNSDILFMNYFYSKDTLGIYAVYSGFAKVLFNVFFYEVFSVVFLPTIAGMDFRLVIKKIEKYIIPVSIAVFSATALVCAIIMLFINRKNVLNVFYIGLLSINIAFYTVFQLYNSIMYMEGEKGALVCLVVITIVIPFSLLLQYVFIHSWNIPGAFIAQILTNGLLIITIKLFISRLVLKRNILSCKVFQNKD